MLFRTPRVSYRLLAACLALAAGGPAWAQLRVATWNISSYSGDAGRTAPIQTVVYGVFDGRSMAPDIILGQEFLSSAAMTTFKNALNSAPGSPGDWEGVFVAGPPTDTEGNAFLYRTSKVVYLGYVIASQGGAAPLPPRNTPRFKVQLQGYTSQKAVLCCYSTHMKAGTAADDKTRRQTEATNIRNNAELLSPDWSFLLGGDYNIYTNTETAYQELIGSQANNEGRFFDPINSTGNWHDSAAYRFVHTQDPVASNGGMDDRFDQLLVSDNLIEGDGLSYIGNASIPYSTTTWNDANHSYRSWGNDGTSFNTGLTTTGNTMVGATIAQAIITCATTAGGHIPLFLDLRVPAEVDSDLVIDFGQVPQNATAQATLEVWNAGNVALWNAAGIDLLRYTLAASTGFTAPGDNFTDAAGDPHNAHVITMDTSTPGTKSGTVTITSNAPDEPGRVVTLLGEVMAPSGCPGDMNCDGNVRFSDIDLFVEALAGQSAWTHSPCPWQNGDCNGDGNVTFADIDPFVSLIGTLCP